MLTPEQIKERNAARAQALYDRLLYQLQQKAKDENARAILNAMRNEAVNKKIEALMAERFPESNRPLLTVLVAIAVMGAFTVLTLWIRGR